MTIRSALMTITKISTAAAIAAGAAGCTHAGGKLMVDTTIVPYHAPDIGDITGNDSDDDDATAPATAPAAGSAAAAQPGH